MSRDRIAQFAVAILNTLGNNDDMALITLPESENKLVFTLTTIFSYTI